MLRILYAPSRGEGLEQLRDEVARTTGGYEAALEAFKTVEVFFENCDSEGLLFHWMEGAKKAGKFVVLIPISKAAFRYLGGLSDIIARSCNRVRGIAATDLIDRLKES